MFGTGSTTSSSCTRTSPLLISTSRSRPRATMVSGSIREGRSGGLAAGVSRRRCATMAWKRRPPRAGPAGYAQAGVRRRIPTERACRARPGPHAEVLRQRYREAAQAAFAGDERARIWERRTAARQGQIRTLYMAQARIAAGIFCSWGSRTRRRRRSVRARPAAAGQPAARVSARASRVSARASRGERELRALTARRIGNAEPQSKWPNPVPRCG
jgi:hypothetical protein